MENQLPQSQQKAKLTNAFGVPYCAKPRKVFSCITPSGKGELPRNRYFIKDGKKCSEPDKPVNLREYLLVNQASCDLGNIIARLEAGDESVINVKQGGITGDLVGMPNSVNAVSDIHKNMLKTYNSLSPEVKALFKNEEEFYSSCLDGTLASKLASINKSKEEVKKEPINESLKTDEVIKTQEDLIKEEK